ncbi:hypothetical protein MGN01_46820 [Methylobacterium gnaphalii]|uniref:Uncharacterized protein n=1 Tax=Methylobacterium gnaphalii TaxID=1010610 RepID=A0A512JS97_9HYPH|nr:hypothetical protein MGN01_46820 [Methylobacterium gnaphalii]
MGGAGARITETRGSGSARHNKARTGEFSRAGSEVEQPRLAPSALEPAKRRIPDVVRM